MRCKKCGEEIGNLQVCPKCRSKAKKKTGCLVPILVLFAFCLGFCLILNGGMSTYSFIDNQQATNQKYEDIAEFMDDYFEQKELFVMEYSVEWIGYSKYSDLYTEEEYEEMGIGGYYFYQANLAGGEYVTGRVSMYWGEGELPVIVDLSYERADGDTPIVEYSDEKIGQCWQTYYEKAHTK